MRGRPLGFLALVASSWIGARTLMLWPEPASRVAAHVTGRGLSLPAQRPTDGIVPPIPRAAFTPPSPSAAVAAGDLRLNDAQILGLYGLRYFIEVHPPRPGADPVVIVPPSAADATGAAVASAAPAASRWSLAAWLSLREGHADPRLTPLLGASQAGVRVSYAVTADRHVAVFGRAATPLSNGGAEVAGGLQWRPAAVPVTAFVEARHRAGAGVAPAVGVFGGGSLRLPGDFRLETYGQAGWVGGRDATGFVDGQARAARTVTRIGGAAIDIGAGAWGAAQRGAARLDVGPGAGVTVPLGRGSLRLGLDWRQRIAGRAAPGSGAALTLGAGF